ncbi:MULTISPECIES: hypothetical protein [unclassified Lysobacter]|uniref:hypothetical protein n=1 Tax=unclassified Lysobacter TaxID=2635362 RepID=UPI001C247C90|nr:hypothetical protein [Lysobacter sp. MMG2]MBU8977491.1 hypothetical protein [Lysobacter sp. MMG2]
MRALPIAPLSMRRALLISGLVMLVAGCRTAPPHEAAVPDAGTATTTPPAVTVTRGEFTVPADKLDVWNAVGQIVVNMRGVEYLGRAQMLDLYSLRYRGVEFLVLTKAMTAAETGNRTLTRVTATTSAGKRIDNDATAELLGMLQRELPAEVERVRARQAVPKKKGKKP